MKMGRIAALLLLMCMMVGAMPAELQAQAEPPRTLTILVEGSGDVWQIDMYPYHRVRVLEHGQVYEFEYNTSINLEPVPGYGYTFAGWDPAYLPSDYSNYNDYAYLWTNWWTGHKNLTAIFVPADTVEAAPPFPPPPAQQDRGKEL